MPSGECGRRGVGGRGVGGPRGGAGIGAAGPCEVTGVRAGLGLKTGTSLSGLRPG